MFDLHYREILGPASYIFCTSFVSVPRLAQPYPRPIDFLFRIVLRKIPPNARSASPACGVFALEPFNQNVPRRSPVQRVWWLSRDNHSGRRTRGILLRYADWLYEKILGISWFFFALPFAAQDLWYAVLTCEILLRIFRHGRQTHAPTQTPRLRHSDRRSEVTGSNPPFRLRRLTNCCGENLGLAGKAQRRSGRARPASDPR
jgi:hypothetical protein